MKTKILLMILVGCLLLLASCTPADANNQDTAPVTSADTQTNVTTSAEQEIVTEAETQREIPDGSFENDLYTVHGVDGVYYLNFNDGNEAETDAEGNLLYMTPQASIQFASVGEMKTRIMEGKLTTEEKEIAKAIFRKDENGIAVPNLNYLFQPSAPSDYQMSVVSWSGNAYTTGVFKENGVFAGYDFLPYDSWEQAYKEEMDIIASQKLNSHEKGYFDGLPCETYVYTTETAKIKKVIVSIPCNNDYESKYAIIKYRLEYFGPMSEGSVAWEVSNTIPTSIEIYGQCQGQNYEILMMYPRLEPTADFLLSFGITPYIEETETPTPLDTVGQEVVVQ